MFQIAAKNNYITRCHHSCFLIIANSFVHFSRRGRGRGIGAHLDNLSPIITQPAVARTRQNFLTRWAYIYHGLAHGFRSRCLVPCCPGGGQVFRLISRCNFSPFFKGGGPPARPFRGRARSSREGK